MAAADLITPEALDAFAKAWHATPEGEPGARRTAGLLAALDIIEPLIRADERERMERASASATLTRHDDGTVTLATDDPNAVRWTPVSLDLIRELVDLWSQHGIHVRRQTAERIAEAIENRLVAWHAGEMPYEVGQRRRAIDAGIAREHANG